MHFEHALIICTLKVLFLVKSNETLCGSMSSVKQDNTLEFLDPFCICPLHSEFVSPAITLGSGRAELRDYSLC
jgi:hypothetical protein